MKKIFNVISVLALLLFIPIVINAQSKYWVFFTDKDGVDFDPYTYFDQKTIEKRLTQGIELSQCSDLPLRNDYIERIEEFSEVKTLSRWLNAVSLILSDEELEKVTALEYVAGIEEMKLKAVPSRRKDIEIDNAELEIIRNQVGTMGADLFRKNEINGKGVRIAIFDIGFTSTEESELFKHLYKENRIIDTWDFTDEDKNVYENDSHGTTVLGCIAGMHDTLSFGLGTGAEFLLARTEVRTEIFAEEEYWAAAMEWADKKGADIISSSLGYTGDRYFPGQMDGKTVYVTRIANLAASKGMLVINAAGNDGDEDWQVINAPADADSVLTVGGISPWTGVHISFSSFGPTADGRMKPNVSAFGQVVSAGKSTVKKSYGTSFSTPLITGFAACIMQMHPDWSNMKVFEEIQKSGHLYPYYDYAHGYGVPQASYFFNLNKEAKKSFIFFEEVENLVIELDIENSNAKSIGPDNEKQGMTLDEDYLYYHILDSKKEKIRKYAVVLMTDDYKFKIPLSEIRPGEMVRVHYQGYTGEYEIQNN